MDVTSFLRVFPTIMDLDYGAVDKDVLIATYICSTALYEGLLYTDVIR